jgi:hypothetical protein
MNPRLTLGLLAVLVALAGYVYFSPESGQANQPAGKDKPAEPQAEVLQFNDRETQRLTAQRGDQQTTVDKTADGNWILQPSGEPADRLRLNGLLIRLSTLRASRRLGEPGDLADFGLATPETSVTIVQADGAELRLLFGARAPAEAGTYVKRPDDPAVYVVSNAIAQDVERLLAEPPREPPTPTPAPATPTPLDGESTATPTP